MKYKLLACIIFLIYLTNACNRSPIDTGAETAELTSEIILQYLESNSNFINSRDVPAIISAASVFEKSDNNILIIDIRNEDVFNKAHIHSAHNVRPDSILQFFENVIAPSAFEHIVIACDIGSRSAYVTAMLRLLGYHNVYSLRFGMSSWHAETAQNTWLISQSSKLEGKLETKGFAKPPKGALPNIKSSENQPYKKLRERIFHLLSKDINARFILHEDLEARYSDFFIINYWPERLYAQGHLPEAVQYTPRRDLHSETYLKSIPKDRPVVIYCFTGQHGAFATAFLHVLGYDVLSLDYGANSFIHNTLKNTQSQNRYFSEAHILNLPVVSYDEEKTVNEEINIEITTPIQGGC